MTPLVTVLGASGFLGSAITRELAGHPILLRAVARRPVALPDHAVADIDVREADLVTADIADIVADADAVIHLVTHNDGGSWRVTEGDLAPPLSGRTPGRTCSYVGDRRGTNAFVVIAGHEDNAIETAIAHSDGYLVVRKEGLAGDIVEVHRDGQ